MLAEQQHDKWKINQWAAQALIERGVTARTVSYDDALKLWSGVSLGTSDSVEFLQTESGAPLGVTRPNECRLNLPSRAFRSVR